VLFGGLSPNFRFLVRGATAENGAKLVTNYLSLKEKMGSRGGGKGVDTKFGGGPGGKQYN